ILMTTDTDLDPLDAIVLYSQRFKIETGFRHAIHVLGSYAYHFWMEEMDPIRRHSGDQHLHMKSEEYRRAVRRKMQAYHAHVQIGCIAQGLLIHLAVNHGEQDTPPTSCAGVDRRCAGESDPSPPSRSGTRRSPAHGSRGGIRSRS